MPTKDLPCRCDVVNEEHRHSGIQFVTPGQRHRGEDHAILAQRKWVLHCHRKASMRSARWEIPVVRMDEVFMRKRLFRPFVDTKGTGMGIGAYECKEYIQEIKGHIPVENQPGQRSCFTVWARLATGTVGSALTDQPEAA